ncbi:MAG: cob(I)yrinic acid a,c-diamide adenosyltransferase [Gammaproteobacteria bacterium]|nr:cob(I)yrinic acid a,c-diamide adenosyltransferase [Gammaproteobacteria bacterium]
MGDRLDDIVTKTGDSGSTGLGDGGRVAKDSLRIEVIGDVDELNAHIGMLLSQELPRDLVDPLSRIQHQLFNVGGELSMPKEQFVRDRDVMQLEGWIEKLNADLPPLKEFVIPGGGMAASACHIARTVCRRAERHAFALDRAEVLNAELLRYLNRLSDLLFIMCRVIMRQREKTEEVWEGLDPGDF